MGWTFLYRPPADERAEIERLHKPHKVHKLMKVGATWFGAFEPEDHPGKIMISVILTRREMGEWGYKEMDETMGPTDCRCPVSILKLATETDNEYALRFRERCWTWARRPKPKIGETYRLTDGSVWTKIKFETYRNVFRNTDGKLSRLHPSMLIGAEKIDGRPV